MTRTDEIHTIRERIAYAESEIVAARRCLEALERQPQRRAVMVALPGTANRYAYLVPDDEPTPLVDAPVALPQPCGRGWTIGRVVRKCSADSLDRAHVECRNITWDFAYPGTV